MHIWLWSFPLHLSAIRHTRAIRRKTAWKLCAKFWVIVTVLNVLTFDISSTVTVSERRNFLHSVPMQLFTKSNVLLSPAPVLIPRLPLFLTERSNTISWIQVPSMLAFHEYVEVCKTACCPLSVFIYLIWAQSPQISMFVVRPVHPQAEEAPSCGDRRQQICYIFKYTSIACPETRHCEISLLYLIRNLKQSTICQRQISVPYVFTGINWSASVTWNLNEFRTSEMHKERGGNISIRKVCLVCVCVCVCVCVRIYAARTLY